MDRSNFSVRRCCRVSHVQSVPKPDRHQWGSAIKRETKETLEGSNIEAHGKERGMAYICKAETWSAQMIASL